MYHAEFTCTLPVHSKHARPWVRYPCAVSFPFLLTRIERLILAHVFTLLISGMPLVATTHPRGIKWIWTPQELYLITKRSPYSSPSAASQSHCVRSPLKGLGPFHKASLLSLLSCYNNRPYPLHSVHGITVRWRQLRSEHLILRCGSPRKFSQSLHSSQLTALYSALWIFYEDSSISIADHSKIAFIPLCECDAIFV